MSRILIVGLCCVDIVHYVDRYPSEDSDTRVFKRVITLGGNAANNVTVLKQLNDDCELFASLPMQDSTLERLTSSIGIDTSRCCRRNDAECPVSTIINNRTTGSRTILHYRGNLVELSVADFIATFNNKLSQYSWIHFEGRNFDEVRSMMEFVRQNRANGKTNAKISVELEKIRPYPYLEQLIPLADALFVSKDFAKHKEWNSMTEAVEAVSQLAPSSIVICAWGDEGAAGRNGTTGAIITHPALKLEKVIDTLGAGDCFIGASLHYLSSGASLDVVLRRACEIAGKKCGQEGLLDLSL